MSPRLTRGQREYTGLMGSSPEDGLAEVRLRSPQMYDAVVEGAFGQMIAQAGLSRAAREMTTVALLAAAGGAERQLTTHACAALRHGVAPAALAADGWGVRYARECVRRGDPVDWAAAWRSFEGLDVQDRLGTLRVRTLVLAGELDASTPPELMARIAGRVPGADYEVLPGTPHMQTLERPELVARALNEFVPAEALDRVET